MTADSTADSAFRDDGLGGIGDLVLDVLGSLRGRALEAAPVQEDTRDLDETDASEEEVDGGEAGEPCQYVYSASGRLDGGEHQWREIEGHVQKVTRLDDEAPSGPDGAGAHERGVLGQGQLISWTSEVGDTGEDEGPLL